MPQHRRWSIARENGCSRVVCKDRERSSRLCACSRRRATSSPTLTSALRRARSSGSCSAFLRHLRDTRGLARDQRRPVRVLVRVAPRDSARVGFRVLAALADLVDAGIPVLWIAGNHDCWGGEVLRDDVGVDYHVGPWRGRARRVEDARSSTATACATSRTESIDVSERCSATRRRSGRFVICCTRTSAAGSRQDLAREPHLSGARWRQRARNVAHGTARVAIRHSSCSIYGHSHVATLERSPTRRDLRERRLVDDASRLSCASTSGRIALDGVDRISRG